MDPGSLAAIALADKDSRRNEMPRPPRDVPNDADRFDGPPTHIYDIKIALAFIDKIKSASLDDENHDTTILQRLRHPYQHPLDVHDPDLRLSIDLFLSVNDSSQDTYNRAHDAILRRHPDDAILSYDQVKRKIAQLSGVVPLIHDMCPNTCVAYTGPFAELESCPECGEPRFDPIRLQASGGLVKIARQEFHTIPLGLQLQALWATPAGATSI
jgi:hypothetical protein